jgi:hypothetical protein
MATPANPSAFPLNTTNSQEPGAFVPEPGMTLRDWFAGQALSNPEICTGTAQEYDLRRWFGDTRTGIRAFEVAAKQAGDYADAMLAERAKGGEA